MNIFHDEKLNAFSSGLETKQGSLLPLFLCNILEVSTTAVKQGKSKNVQIVKEEIKPYSHMT